MQKINAENIIVQNLKHISFYLYIKSVHKNISHLYYQPEQLIQIMEQKLCMPHLQLGKKVKKHHDKVNNQLHTNS